MNLASHQFRKFCFLILAVLLLIYLFSEQNGFFNINTSIEDSINQKQSINYKNKLEPDVIKTPATEPPRTSLSSTLTTTTQTTTTHQTSTQSTIQPVQTPANVQLQNTTTLNRIEYEKLLEKIASQQNTNQNVSLFCMIMTAEKNFIKRSITVMNTWAKRCTKVFFFCSCEKIAKLRTFKDGEKIPEELNEFRNVSNYPVYFLNMTEDYWNMAEKAILTIKEAYSSFGTQYSWFLMTDDDTYIFMNNLFNFIKDKGPHEPVTYGHNFKVIVRSGYQDGGAGILFTQESMKRLHESIIQGRCQEKKGYSDVTIGLCRERSNVTMGVSINAAGSERFHLRDLETHFFNQPYWSHEYSSNPVKSGVECCSEDSISFHYASKELMSHYNALERKYNKDLQ